MRLFLIVIAAGIAAQAQNTKDVIVAMDGGPAIHLTATLSHEGNGVRFIAKATNNLSVALDGSVKLCVVADTPKKTPCLFTLWNTEPWKAGAELSWDLSSKLDLPDLWFDVKIDQPATEVQQVPPASPKNKRIQIQIVDAQSSQRDAPIYLPGSPASSTTGCTGSATASGSGNVIYADGSSTCNTTYKPATPTSVINLSIAQEHADAILPNGRHVVLWCQNGFRKCRSLEPGYYPAELEGNSVWVYGQKLDGSEEKIKYQSVGGW